MSMSCVDTKEVRVETLVLPEPIASCVVGLRDEFDLRAVDPLSVCLYIADAECALEKRFSEFCPAEEKLVCNAFDHWTHAQDCLPAANGVEPGEKLAIKLQLVRADRCPRAAAAECSAAGSPEDSSGCFLGFSYEYDVAETGALVPQEIENLELWYSALFSDAHELGADDLPVLCPNLNLSEGGDRVTVNLTVAMRQAARGLPAGALSVSPYPMLADCEWPENTMISSYECKPFTLATGGNAPIKLTPELTEANVTPASWLGCAKPEGVQGGQRCVLDLSRVSGVGDQPPPAINLTAIFP